MSAPTTIPPVTVSRRALLRREARLQAVTAGVLWLLALALAAVGSGSGVRLVDDLAGMVALMAGAVTVVCVVWLLRAAAAR